jgi:hypothetical protein
LLASLKQAGLTLDDLVAAGLLPQTVSASVVDQAVDRLTPAVEQRVLYPELAADLSLLETIRALTDERRHPITMFVRLVQQISGAAGCSVAAVRWAVQRHLPLAQLVGMDLTDLKSWFAQNTDISGVFEPPDPDAAPGASVAPLWRPTEATLNAAWSRWSGRVLGHLRGDTGSQIPLVCNDDLLLAAADTLPGSLFRYDLGLVSVNEWSVLVMEGALFKQMPSWTIIAGLHALGFGNPLLESVVKACADRAPDCRVAGDWRKFAAAASTSVASGSLVVTADTAPDAGLPSPGAPPILRLHIGQLARYAEALDWLQTCNPFEEVVDDRDETQSA